METPEEVTPARKTLYYLATPYSSYSQGLDAAFEEACKATAELIRRGMAVFSPIAHSHYVAKLGNLDLLDHKIWLPLDLVVLRACDVLIVLKMPGWQESHGVSQEIKYAEELCKPVIYMTWPILRGNNST